MYQKHAKEIRRNIIKMVAEAKAAHTGSALSVVNIYSLTY